MEDGPDYEWTEADYKHASAPRAVGPGYQWTEDDYKRASAPRMVDFMRFNALVEFDRQDGPHNMSRREYAFRINERIRDVDDDDDVPDTTRTRNQKEEDEDKDKDEEESKKESFDLDGDVMKEELQKRIKWAYWLSEWNKKMKKEGGKIDPVDGEAMGQEFQRRINWTCEICKKHGLAAADAAAKSLNQAVREAAAALNSS